MKKNDIAFLILSFDNFKVTWKPCVDHLFNAWPDCPYTVYLLNNYIPYQDNRIENLLVGEDISWSDTLIKGLKKIGNKRIFLLYDDAFINKVDSKEVQLIFTIAEENNLDSVALRKRVFDRGNQYSDKLYRINPTAKYRNSLFLNLIKKDVLLTLLQSGETNWQFEKEGNKRSKNLDFYSVYKKEIVTYHHGIIKGKWMPDVYKYLKNSGYLLEDNKLEIHSIPRVIVMNLYTLIFYCVHKFLHLFK